jgi:cytochrome c-type biogenesis protein CcsB
MGSQVYLLVTLGLYTVSTVDVLLHALTRRRLLGPTAITATLVGFAVHTAAISQRWTEVGHFPVIGLRDGSSFLAWTLTLAFLALWARARFEVLGLAVHPAVFVLMLVANLGPRAEQADPILRGLYLPVHATLAFFGYAALFVAFAMGVAYLFQERELRRRSPSNLYYLIPSLERCDTIGGRAVAVGFGFLTLAIVTGNLWSHAVHGHYWRWDAKELSALLAWIIYIVLIVARLRTGWGGRRAAIVGIAGFATVVFTFVWMMVFAVRDVGFVGS